MKFSERTSNQSIAGLCSRRCEKWTVRRPIPKPRSGRSQRLFAITALVPEEETAADRGLLRRVSLLLGLLLVRGVDGYGAAALSLAGVLPGAAVVARGASPLRLAVVLTLAVMLQGSAAPRPFAVVLAVGPLAFTVVLTLADVLGGLVVLLGALLFLAPREDGGAGHHARYCRSNRLVEFPAIHMLPLLLWCGGLSLSDYEGRELVGFRRSPRGRQPSPPETSQGCL